MIRPSDTYQRIIKYPGTHRVVNVGNGKGRVHVRKVPESQMDVPTLLKEIAALPPHESTPFGRGAGDRFILVNDCDLYYYINNVFHIMVQVRHT